MNDHNLHQLNIDYLLYPQYQKIKQKAKLLTCMCEKIHLKEMDVEQLDVDAFTINDAR